MLHSRLPLTGIDVPIERMQKELFDGLICAWELDESQYESYGRIYRNPSNGGFIPEAYRSDGEYREVLLDDRYAALSFFGDSGTTTVSGGYNVSQVHVVFFAHLGAVSALPTRADGEARAAVQAILAQNPNGFTIQNIVVGAAASLAEYAIGKGQASAGVRRDLKEADMHPFHCFRVNGTLRYPAPQLN